MSGAGETTGRERDAEPYSDRAGSCFAAAVLALAVLAFVAPWAALVVAGYAYATPIRRHGRLLLAVWIIGGAITAYFIFLAVGVLLPSTVIDVGPVHRVH
jgi:hypothetical protein